MPYIADKSPHISTEELMERRANPTATLIDVRPVDAYNGWWLKGESRGGHIAGARSLPAKWAGYIDWPDIVQAKGIAPGYGEGLPRTYVTGETPVIKFI